MKQSEISSSGKPLSLQAGGTKGRGGISRAQSESHLKEAGGPSGIVELAGTVRRHNHGERDELPWSLAAPLQAPDTASHWQNPR